MRKTSVLIILFTVLGLFLISSSFAAVKTYEEYVASLENGYEPVPREVFEQAMKEGQLNIYDWASWWDEDLYDDFSKIFGIKIVRDNFANYEEMLTKYKLNPNLKYDFVLPGPRSFDQMKALGLISKLNHDWLPNVTKNIRPAFKQMAFDPGNQYTVLYGLGMAGYVVNTSFVDKNDPRLGHWSYLFDAPKDLPSHGKLIVRDNMFSTIGAALQYLGYSLNSVDEKELMEAKKALLELKPYIMAFDSWPKRQIIGKQSWVTGPHNLGDYMPFMDDVPGLIAVLPKGSTELRGSCLVIPKPAPHKAVAHLWINYLFRRDRAVKHSISSGHVSPHKEVFQLLPPKVKAFPVFQATGEYIQNSEFLEPPAYTGKGLEIRTKIWEELKK